MFYVPIEGPELSDAEIAEGTGGVPSLITAAQVKMGAELHGGGGGVQPPALSDADVVAGTATTPSLISATQAKLAAETFGGGGGGTPPPALSDAEIIAGTATTPSLISAAQARSAVRTHGVRSIAGVTGTDILLGTNLSMSGNTINATASGGSSTGMTFFTNVAAMKAASISGVANRTQVSVAGYYTEDDGGGGIFFFDSTSTAADNGGTVIAPNAGSGRWRRVNAVDPVNALWFGARRDGSADARPALQTAINYCQANQFCNLYIPAGRYLLNGVTAPDGKLNGLVIAPSDPVAGTAAGHWRALRISGAGRATSLIANSDNMVVIRCAGSNNVVAHLSISGGNRPNVWGVLVGPESMTQTTTRIDTSYNVVHGLFIKQCTEGLVQTPGPTVGSNSGCYYNGYRDMHIYGCIRGIWLRLGVHTDNSPNRNSFFNIRIGGGGNPNTGVQIDAGDTNQFVSVHCEGIRGTVGPNNPAVALRIKEFGGGSWNHKNTFIACMMEGNTTNILNDNTATVIVACNGIP